MSYQDSSASEEGVEARYEVGEQRIYEIDRSLWTQLASATSSEALCQNWLAIQCRMIGGITGALVLLRSAAGKSYAPAAVWPDVRRDMAHLSKAAEQALKEQREVLLRQPAAEGEADYHIAYPIEVGATLYGAVVLEVPAGSRARVEAVVRQLHWGAAWLTGFFARQEGQQGIRVKERLIAVLELLALCAEQPRFHAAATAFVTEMAGRLSCDRVSIGFVEGKRVVVKALSHNANFEKKADLIRDIEAVMDEAIEQQQVVLYPGQSLFSDTPLINRFGEHLADKHGIRWLCAVPFRVHGTWAGAIVLERTQGEHFTKAEVELCEAAAAMAGSVLDTVRLNDRPIHEKLFESTGKFFHRFWGPGHTAWKLAALCGTALLLFLALVGGDYRVTADATLEGAVQRAVVAPFEGYILEAHRRAGDTVYKGDNLARLDDRDLLLEKSKWSSEYNQYSSQYRRAKAEHDWAQVRINGAQLAQAQAKLNLLNEQLSRSYIKAPFDGVLISGELDQKLGAPVSRGDMLFVVAPLEGYRLILKVDDRDIMPVEEGQRGEISLSAMPGEAIPFTVENITAVSVAEEGRNYFRVEAKLDNPNDQLRPGMEGVGKIHIGERNLFWIWTHALTNELRLWLWSWWR